MAVRLTNIAVVMTLPRSMVSTKFPADPQEVVKLHFHGVAAPAATGEVPPKPQSLRFAFLRSFTTASRIARMDAGVAVVRSNVDWLEPIRAASREACVTFCFRL